MRLREKQSLFSRLLPRLLDFIHSHDGWETTLGDGHVERQVGHRVGSLHYYRLAQDINLFIDGKYIMDGKHPAWLEIGEFWEGLHDLCRWGGRFQTGYDPVENFPLEFTGKDSNHFSVTHDGKA